MPPNDAPLKVSKTRLLEYLREKNAQQMKSSSRSYNVDGKMLVLDTDEEEYDLTYLRNDCADQGMSDIYQDFMIWAGIEVF